jgi:fructosamine-3-kinase
MLLPRARGLAGALCAVSPTLRRSVVQLLQAQLGCRHVVRQQPVTGGDVDLAARWDTECGSVFVKWSPDGAARFHAERDGLERLARTGCVRVPEVIGVAESEEGAALVLRWVEAQQRTEAAAATLGLQLAALHRHTAEAYGLERDNFIGPLPQRNTPTESWVEFYRVHRLGVQAEMAGRRRSLDPSTLRALDRLAAGLDRWLSEPEEGPSLLHGDLWAGNWLLGPHGPVVVDPAVYYGHREVELAFTELFGGFPHAFYATYRDVWPLAEGYEDRRPLYQLYPLLVHANLFGGAYAQSVRRVVRRYAG